VDFEGIWFLSFGFGPGIGMRVDLFLVWAEAWFLLGLDGLVLRFGISIGAWRDVNC
jgi:hypothetical protein